MSSTTIKTLLDAASSLCTAGAGALAISQPGYAALCVAGAALFKAIKNLVSDNATNAKIAAAK